jgi:tight adherence protein C
MYEYIPLLVVLLAFGSVMTLTLVVGQYLKSEAHLQRRLTASGQKLREPTGQRVAVLQEFITKNFDERRFGVDSTLRGKLRRDLVRAGFFGINALNYYIFARIAVVLALPLLAYAGTAMFLARLPWFLRLPVVLISLLLAIVGPDAYIARRQRILTQRFRELFPDFLDLLTVCVDAGLSIEAALDRVTPEISAQSREFGLNLLMLSAEMRAGRSAIQALESMAERLGLDEARSFVLVLRQSIELGSDISEALRVFSEEMRHKRLLRAEEAANKLPVKLLLPLGGFIFPVILLVVLLPIFLRLMRLLYRN